MKSERNTEQPFSDLHDWSYWNEAFYHAFVGAVAGVLVSRGYPEPTVTKGALLLIVVIICLLFNARRLAKGERNHE